MRKTISIARDFSETPGGRYRKDGPDSGEEFREDVLIPNFKDISSGDRLTIDLDGGYGYPVSFLEEAFGGLARHYGSKIVLERLAFIANEEPSIVEQIKEYIQDAT
jgi:hypothetical protein